MQNKQTLNISFYKRSIICFIIIIVLFFTSILRITGISTENYDDALTLQNGIKLTLYKPRGTIFDCNRIPLTNSKKQTIAAVSPIPRAITAISSILKGDELNSVLERLKGGKPIFCEIPEKIDCDGIVCFDLYSTEKIPSLHLLGYTDGEGNGISGIEKAYNDILKCEEEISVFYYTDAKGRILEGIKPIVNDNSITHTNGVVTTIDINIQNIVEKYAKNIKKGAIIIAESNSGKIRGCVSKPTFDYNNISKYMNDTNSPLINRALNSYNVGSVFKPCVAIAGVESNLQYYKYCCTGSCEIIDRYFKCHSLIGHGNLDLPNALALSCNTYFYNFAAKIGEKNIYNTAKKFCFDKSLKVGENIYVSKGNLPNLELLSNIAHLANFSIGQGELLISPISILPLYCAIANNGEYYIPSVIEGTIKKGKFDKYDNGTPTKAIQTKTAKYLKNCLSKVLLDGTGKSALPKTVTAAGKTATAQTGKYKNGLEICQGWFCGFFPLENPKYTVVIFCEDISENKTTCSEIFSLLADEINLLKTK